MGEAKNRLDSLGPTRRLRIERADLFNLITNFIQPGQDGKPRMVGDRVKRRPFNSAMGQLGVLDVWRRARAGSGTLDRDVIAATPEVQFKDVSVDAIRTLQEVLGVQLDVRDSLNLADFEDMLDGALAGTYDPEEPPAPALTSVPPETDPAPAPEDPTPPPDEAPAPAV